MKREEKDGLAGIRTETVLMRSRLEQSLILVKIHSTLFPFSLRMGLRVAEGKEATTT